VLRGQGYSAVIGAMVECRLTGQRRRNLDRKCTPDPFHPPQISHKSRGI